MSVEISICMANEFLMERIFQNEGDIEVKIQGCADR